MDVQEVAWDLDPLVDGEGPEAPIASSTRPTSARLASPRPMRARSPSSTAPAWPPRWASSRRSSTPRARRLLRDAALRTRHGRSGQRGAARARPGARHDHRDEAPVLRARVGGARRRARRRAARGRRASTPRATTCARCAATGPTCSPSPRRSSSPRRRSPAAARGRGCSPSSRAPSASSSPTPTRACRSTSPSAASSRPTASCAAPPPRRSPPRSSPACAPAPSSSTRSCTTRPSTTGCARYPGWLASRNLANEASDESVEALLEAVRASYDLPQRWYRLKAELLGVDRLADYDRMASVADEEAPSTGPRRPTSCSRRSTSSRPSWATSPSASSTSAGSTPRCARTSAAAPSAPTRRRACTPT